MFLTVYILKKIEQKKDISDTEDVPKTDEPKQLILSTRTQTEIVNMENISHISVEEHYSRIFYQMDGKTEEKLIKIPLKKILTELPDENFIQVHRSHIVNLSFVAKISREKGKGKVTMNSTDNPEIPVSRRKYLEVQEKVASFFNI